MKKTIEHLLNTAPALDNPIVTMMKADANVNALRSYLDCQLVLRGGYMMAGILTQDDGWFDCGALRMCSVAKDPTGKILVADHRFAADEVQAIIVARALPEQMVQVVRKPLIVPGA